jgi:hypothetical protein
MNAHDRRQIERMVRSVIADATDQKSQPQDPSPKPPTKPQTKPKTKFLWPWETVAWAAITALSSIAGATLTAYVALPAWSLTLPSSSYRPRNPFTAVFTVTNAGYLPGEDVKVQCIQNRINYAGITNNLHSSGLVSQPVILGSIRKNRSRNFSCPQVVLGIQTWNRAITPEEVKQAYLAGPPKEDMSFDWADFEFHIMYSLAIFHWEDKYRVVGRPAENGTFVWEEVALDKKF